MKILVYGSYHTNDSTDDEIKDIEQKLTAFRPEVVLYEGDNVSTEETKDLSIHYYFEMGLVKWWADKHNIPAINIEPPAKDKHLHLQRKYATDHILLASVLGQNILYIKQHSKADFETLYPLLIKDFEKEGFYLAKKEKSHDYFYKVYEDFYKIPFDPETFDYETVEIKFNKTLLNEINQEAAAFRDQYMLQKIDSCRKKLNRVYVQVGGRHAIVWQPAIEKMVK